MDIVKCNDELLKYSSYDRRLNIAQVLNAYRSILGNVAYASTAVTTGRHYYKVLEKYGVKTLDELNALDENILKEEIIKPNVREGNKFAEKLAKRINKPVIAPGIFDVQLLGWTQDEGIFLWYEVIGEKAESMHMADGWGYVSGSRKEFKLGIKMQFGYHHPFIYRDGWSVCRHFPREKLTYEMKEQMTGIKIFDHKDKELRIEDGINKIAETIRDLEYRGFETKPLVSTLWDLYEIGANSRSSSIRGQNKNPGFHAFQKPYECDYEKMGKEINRLFKEFHFTADPFFRDKGIVDENGNRYMLRYIFD
jgi:hypothetical protein